jgi:hypothetical protein
VAFTHAQDPSDFQEFCSVSFEKGENCGCVLLNENQVITSAKCIANRFGRAKVTFSEDLKSYTEVYADKIANTNELDGVEVEDTAVIFLSEPIETNSKRTFKSSKTLNGDEANEYLKTNLPNTKFNACKTEKGQLKCSGVEFVENSDEKSESAFSVKFAEDGDWGGPVYARQSSVDSTKDTTLNRVLHIHVTIISVNLYIVGDWVFISVSITEIDIFIFYP